MKVYGTSGTPVVLLPGGAAPCEGFFPGLVEGLVADPGCRVVVHDRPGTGSAGPGDLAGATAHLHGLVQELGMGPVVAVGQSLGGAVATLWARDHPDDLAGIVLLDATPINDPRLCAVIEGQMRVFGPLGRVPVLGAGLDGLFHRLGRRQMDHLRLPAEVQSGVEPLVEGGLAQLGAATRGLRSLSLGLQEADLPLLPAAVVTAERRAGAAITQAHERLATAFGTSLTSWPGATHTVHLDHAPHVLGVVRDVVGRIDLA